MEEFNFSLQKVLEYGLQVEDQVKGHFAEVNRLENEKNTELDQVMQEKDSMMETPQFSVSRMQVTRRYIQALNDQIMICHDQLLGLQAQKEQIRSELIEAQKQRKILERLKSKQLAQYQKELAREEQKQLDDFHRPQQNVNIA